MKLNLGCGRTKMPDYVNVDKAANAEPDVILDIEREQWPWPDQSITEIQVCHVLEHLSDISHFFTEAYRVMKPGAQMAIAVPHPRSDHFMNDPTHVTAITDQTLMLFSKENCDTFKAKGWANTPLAHYLDVDFRLLDGELNLNEHWMHLLQPGREKELDHAVKTFNNVVDQFKFVLERV